MVDNSHHQPLVETKCDNDKCIMCAPIPSSSVASQSQSSHRAILQKPDIEHRTTQIVSQNKFNVINNNNNYAENNTGEIMTVPGMMKTGAPPPPPLPKKTVAPYQVCNKNNDPSVFLTLTPCYYQIHYHNMRNVQIFYATCPL